MLKVFYQDTDMEMLEETYLKFKNNIIPKMKKEQPHFQEPEIEYCKPEQILELCSHNHYLVKEQVNEGPCQHKIDNNIYDTTELEHEFKYGIYEDVLKPEELMAELKCIDEEEQEQKVTRNIKFQHFPLEQFSDAGKVDNEGDSQLK